MRTKQMLKGSLLAAVVAMASGQSAKGEEPVSKEIPIFTPSSVHDPSQSGQRTTATSARVDTEATKVAKRLMRPGNHGRQVAIRGAVYELESETLEKAQAILADLPRADRYAAFVRFIHQLEEGEARLVGKPVIVASEGSWSVVRMVREVTYPSEYQPAQVPKAFAKVISPDGGDSIATLKTEWEDADTPVFLSPFPESFETRELGLVTRMRPHRGKGGRSTWIWNWSRALCPDL